MARTIRLPSPHQGQRIVRQQAKRFNWLSAGRRWRKTTMGMSIAVESALAGKRILWGAPTFDQVRIGWEEAKHGVGNQAKFTQQRMTAEFPSGGVIVYRSLDDPDNARGHTADGVVVDEAAEVKEVAWYEVLRPMLLDTEGWAWFLFTPKGRNWTWREHQAAIDRDDTMAWQVPTLGVAVEDGRLVRRPHELENPYIGFEEIEQIWRTTPQQIFEQEILAQFIESSGAVFRRILDAATATEQDKALDGHDYAFGVDWGKHNDFTVIQVLDTTDGALAYMDRFNQIDYQVQLGRLQALYEKFAPSVIIAESNAMGEPLIEQLQRAGMPVQPFQTTNASKAQAIDALSLAFEREELRILPDPTLVGELQAFEQKRMASGLMRYAAPEGMHDDSVIALALAWSAVSERNWYLF